jgi:LmbE family N-acetylglucosaminyl deacetylase
VRAAELAGTPQVFESTLNRDHLVRLMAAAREAGEIPEGEDPGEIGDGFGMPEDRITTFVDVSDVVELKRQAMRAHASQIAENSFFLAMPEEAFSAAFGTEWFIHRGAPAGTRETSLV